MRESCCCREESYIKSIPLRIYWFVPLLALITIAYGQTEQSKPDFAKLDEIVDASFYSVADVKIIVNDSGPTAAEHLAKRYETEENVFIRGKILLCFSELGAEGTTTKAIDYIKEQMKGEMTREQRDGVNAAFYALGNLGTSESLAFLATLVNETHWTGDNKVTSFKGRDWDTDKIKTIFAETAASSIALAATDESIALLQSLRSQVSETFVHNLDDAVDEAKRLKENTAPANKNQPLDLQP